MEQGAVAFLLHHHVQLHPHIALDSHNVCKTDAVTETSQNHRGWRFLKRGTYEAIWGFHTDALHWASRQIWHPRIKIVMPPSLCENRKWRDPPKTQQFLKKGTHACWWARSKCEVVPKNSGTVLCLITVVSDRFARNRQVAMLSPGIL